MGTNGSSLLPLPAAGWRAGGAGRTGACSGGREVYCICELPSAAASLASISTASGCPSQEPAAARTLPLQALHRCRSPRHPRRDAANSGRAPASRQATDRRFEALEVLKEPPCTPMATAQRRKKPLAARRAGMHDLFNDHSEKSQTKWIALFLCLRCLLPRLGYPEGTS